MDNLQSAECEGQTSAIGKGAQGKCKGNPSSTKGLGCAQSLLLEIAQEHKC